MMTKSSDPTRNPDDLLADFADRVLNGKTSEIHFSADGDLRRLEETVVRLSRAFPSEEPDEKSILRMQAGIKTTIRSAGSAPRSAWKSRQSRQRLILAFATLVIFAGVYIILPFLSSGSGNIEGTAGLQTQGTVVLIAVGGVIALLIWLGRRK